MRIQIFVKFTDICVILLYFLRKEPIANKVHSKNDDTTAPSRSVKHMAMIVNNMIHYVE